MKFNCNQCSASFNQLKGLVEHYETIHNPENQQYSKLREAIAYSGSDSGCQTATEYLGYQSFCLKCPFPKCVFDEPGVGVTTVKKRNRNEEIRQRLAEGASISDMAKAFNVSKRTIQRVTGR